jgi:hypothetical protein
MSRELEYLQSLVDEYQTVTAALYKLESTLPALYANEHYIQAKALTTQRDRLIIAMGTEFPRLMARYNHIRETRTPDTELFKLIDLLKLDNTQVPLYYLDVIKAAREKLLETQEINNKLFALIREITPMLGTTWVENYDAYDAWRERAKKLLSE